MPAPTCVKVEMLPGREGQGSLNAPTTETVPYQVTFDTPDAFAQDAMHANDTITAVPAPGSVLSGTYTGLILQSIVPRQNPVKPTLWLVLCNYAQKAPQQLSNKPPSVAKYNVDISGTTIPREYEVDTDASGNPIRSSGGDPILGITRTKYDEQISVSYHCRAPDWATLNGCIGSGNTGNVTLTINGASRTFAAKTLKFENFAWALEYDADQAKTVRIDQIYIYRKDTWVHAPADIGFHTRSGSTIKAITIGAVNAANGSNITDTTIKGTPTYLNGSGGILPDMTGGSPTPAHKLSFESIQYVDFTTLLAEIST